jgi:hypothetical protein
MSSAVERLDGTAGVGIVLSVVRQDAEARGTLDVASGEVISRRMALLMAAVGDPANADQLKLARLVPQKLETAVAAAAILLERSAEMSQRVAMLAVDEVAVASRAMVAMATSTSPAMLAAAQSDYASARCRRLVAQSLLLGVMALRAQRAALAPFQRAATDNARRLRG